MKRICSLINVKPETLAEYERIHADVWPDVLACLKRSNVQNYSIYRYNNLLVSYMEYVGENYEEDMAKIAADPRTQEWWKVTVPMQSPLPDKLESEWWHAIPEVFHLD